MLENLKNQLDSQQETLMELEEELELEISRVIQLKNKLEPELQDLSKSLKNEFDQIKKSFVSELPEGSGLKSFLESNLDKYMRASFSVFTNPRFTPGDDVVENHWINIATEVLVDAGHFIDEMRDISVSINQVKAPTESIPLSTVVEKTKEHEFEPGLILVCTL